MQVTNKQSARAQLKDVICTMKVVCGYQLRQTYDVFVCTSSGALAGCAWHTRDFFVGLAVADYITSCHVITVGLSLPVNFCILDSVSATSTNFCSAGAVS